jgi:hypothetical protein
MTKYQLRTQGRTFVSRGTKLYRNYIEQVVTLVRAWLGGMGESLEIGESKESATSAGFCPPIPLLTR